MMTPDEKFRSLPEAESYLKPGATLQKLNAIAAECSDNEAAQRALTPQLGFGQNSLQLINKTQQRTA